MQPELNQFNCSLKSKAAVLVEHTPVQRVAIETDVTIAYTQTHNLITRSSNHVDVEVEVVSNRVGSFESHRLQLLEDDSSDCGNPHHNSFNNVHVFVEVFAVINLLQFHDQIVSGRESFGQFHCFVCVVFVLIRLPDSRRVQQRCSLAAEASSQ
jgi:hypothetical protein